MQDSNKKPFACTCSMTNQIFDTLLQMSIPHVWELSFVVSIFCKKYKVLTTVLILTLRDGFIVVAVNILNISYLLSEMK